MGSSTVWDPQTYSQNARFVSDLGEPLLNLLDARAGERILDLGCGDGALTKKIAALGAWIVGVDASAPQLEAARGRGIDVVAMDGERLSFRRVFDAIFTNAALHWMKEPERVVEGVIGCLKPGGRFVGEFGGHGNVKTVRSALHAALRGRGIDPWSVDPWYYPSSQEYAALLARYGFTIGYIELIPRPTPLPGDVLAWLDVFAQPFTNAIGTDARPEFLTDVRTVLEPSLRRSDGVWIVDYVRLRFKARRA